MSLEIAIQQNTAAINALIEILSKGLGVTTISPDALEEQVLEKKPLAKRVKKEAAPAAPEGEPTSAPSPASTVSDAPEAAAAATATKAATYDEAAKAVTAVASKHGRAAALEILERSKPGAKSLRDIDATDYGAVVCACELALA
jgi:hypothetical protein